MIRPRIGSIERIASIVRGAAGSHRALKWRSPPTRIDRSLIAGGYVTGPRPTISTHILDTGTGAPAAGVPVRLWRSEPPGSAELLSELRTDADGRIRDLLAGARLIAGRYRLEFGLDDGGFFTGLSVDVAIDDPERSYHVPLLRAPFGLSTYRGS